MPVSFSSSLISTFYSFSIDLQNGKFEYKGDNYLSYIILAIYNDEEYISPLPDDYLTSNYTSEISQLFNEIYNLNGEIVFHAGKI
jgi:hypothetical protein